MFKYFLIYDWPNKFLKSFKKIQTGRKLSKMIKLAEIFVLKSKYRSQVKNPCCLSIQSVAVYSDTLNQPGRATSATKWHTNLSSPSPTKKKHKKQEKMRLTLPGRIAQRQASLPLLVIRAMSISVKVIILQHTAKTT